MRRKQRLLNWSNVLLLFYLLLLLFSLGYRCIEVFYFVCTTTRRRNDTRNQQIIKYEQPRERKILTIYVYKSELLYSTELAFQFSYKVYLNKNGRLSDVSAYLSKFKKSKTTLSTLYTFYFVFLFLKINIYRAQLKVLIDLTNKKCSWIENKFCEKK